EAASTCGRDGMCDGAGACERWTAGTVCVAGSCAGGVSTPARTCNGAGTCQTVTTSACNPYVCGATACKTSCGSNADCDATHFCSGGGCVSTNANGVA